MRETADLSGRVAFVSGAGRGIGRGIVETLAEAGAEVALNALTLTHAEPLAKRVADSTGKRVIALAGDVTTESGAEEMIAATLRAFGRIDILVNNLGDSINKPLVALPGDERGGMSEAELDRVIALNLDAALACTRAAGPHLLERRSGKVVNISSIAAGRGGANTIGYTTAKTALTGFTRALALEWAPFNIQVNAVAPGSFPDPVTAGDRYESAMERAAANAPAGRAGDVREVGHAVCFLASPLADYITGQTLFVDGGASLR